MSANQNVIMRNEIPVELQGRVYACRNTLQFFTIPIGLFLGGFLVDRVCEPYMSNSGYALSFLFGEGKGSGAAMVLFILGVAGTAGGYLRNTVTRVILIAEAGGVSSSGFGI